METKLEHGKWYKNTFDDEIVLQYNKNNENECIGYVYGYFGTKHFFDKSFIWVPTTYVDLEKLGTEHREHYVFSLEELSDGICAIEKGNDIQKLRAVLKFAFPHQSTNDLENIFLDSVVAYQSCWFGNIIHMYNDELDKIKPIQSVDKFYEQLPNIHMKYPEDRFLTTEVYNKMPNLKKHHFQEHYSATKDDCFSNGNSKNGVREFDSGATNETMGDKFQAVADGVAGLLTYKNEKYGNSALVPLNIFNGKTKVGQRMDDKVARIQNSPTLRKNDIADLIGYLMLVCVENEWTNFDEFKD